MKKTRYFFPLLFFLFLSFGITFFFYLYTKSSSFSILEHSFRPSFVFLLPAVGFTFILLVLLWAGFAKLENKLFHTGTIHALKEGLYPFIPLSITWLSPFILRYYMTREDLKTRLDLLTIAMIFIFIFIKLTQINNISPFKKFLNKGMAGFQGLPKRKKLVILFLTAFAVYNISTYCIVSRGFAFNGDEPYYLLTAHSIYQDKDINVANNYENQDYFHFYPREVYPNLRLSAYARWGKKGDGYLYHVNQPGISVLVQPFYALSRIFEGKTRIFILKGSLSIWAVLLGIQLFLFSNELWKNEKKSLALWFLYSFSAPILFYAIHLYPEVPIAFFSLYVFRKARSPGSMSLFQYVFLGFLLSLFFWFGLKYNLIIWPLLLVCCYYFLKEKKARWKILSFLFFPFLSMALNYYYIYALYGNFNPISIYEGVLNPDILKNFKDIMLKTPILLRIDTFFDYFLDQRDGLFLYSPLYFFSFLGFIEVFRREKKDFFAFLFIPSLFILNYAFFAHRQGGCPQGRVLTSVSWVLILLVGYFFVYNKKNIYKILFRIACCTSFIFFLILLRNPSFLLQPTTHEYTFRGGDLFIFLSNINFSLYEFLPSFIKVNNLGYVPNYVWLGLILLFVAGYASKVDIKLPSRLFLRSVLATFVLLVFFGIFSLYPRTVLLFPVKASYSPAKEMGFYSPAQYSRMINPGEFYLSKNNHEYVFNFTSRREIKDLELQFGNSESTCRTEIKLFDEILFEGETINKVRTQHHLSPPRYRFKNTNLYQIRIKISLTSGEPFTKKPYFFSIYPSETAR